MATHFVCQSAEPLPHVYPTGLSSLSHGAVSQYEVFNEGKKAHTQFPPPGWDFSQTSEEDSLPLVQSVPLPEWKNTSFHQDPELCITPQKPRQQAHSHVDFKHPTVFAHKKPDKNPDPLLAITPERPRPQSNIGVDKDHNQAKKHRVRFDIEEDADNWEDEDSVTENNLQGKIPPKTSPEKVYQPELYGDDDDKFEFENSDHEDLELAKPNLTSKTVKYKVGKVNSQTVYVPFTESNTQNSITNSNDKLSQDSISTTQNKNSISKGSGLNFVKVTREKGRSEGKSEKSETKFDKDPIATSVVPEQNGQKRRVKVLRENQYAPSETEYTYPFNHDPLAYAGGEEHMFARPEYNSTLRMKVEAEKLKSSSIDIEKALQKKLTMSESIKTSIHEKAAALVSTSGQQYTGLANLDVPVEELCKHVVDQKTARAKQVKMPKKKLTDAKEPDLLDFFSADRQKESVTFTMPGISAPSEKLSTVAHRRAFDLYKHNRVWERSGYKK